MQIITSDTINSISLHGEIKTDPIITKTEESSFATFSLLTVGRTTDYHEITVYEHTPIYSFCGELKKGGIVTIKGCLTYQDKEIRDDKGEVVAKVTEARIIAKSINIGE